MNTQINLVNWFTNQDVLGPIVSIFFTIIFIDTILPLIRKKKNEANIKLSKFYNTAYAFVKIREGFSIKMNGQIHNKENCGEFHSFLSNNLIVGNIIFEEQAFFNFVTNNFVYVDSDLSSLFLEYFKVRFPETVKNKIGCGNSKMIKLRKEIEKKILKQYENYKKLII